MTAHPPGYNPLRWNCAERGCYNVKHRPKIEVFADCFPGRIGMGDVDGLVEIRGHFLLLEWKSVDKPLPTGQRITYEQLTKTSQFVVLIVTGDPETMTVNAYSICINGRVRPPVKGDLETVKARIRSWVEWARRDAAAA